MRKFLIMALALLALSPAMLFAQVSLTESMAGDVTGTYFVEPADQYLSTFRFGDLEQTVFMLQVQPRIDTSTSLANIGFGSWFGGLYGAAYYGFENSTYGDLGGGQSAYQYQDDDFILGGADGLTIMGTTGIKTEKILYTVNTTQNPVFLAGFRLGDLTLGIKNDLNIYGNNQFGTYDLSGAVAESSWTSITDTAGVVSYLDSTEYALGSENNTSFTDTLSAGFTLPLGAMTLGGNAGFQFKTEDYSNSYAMESRTVQVGAGYAAYTPVLALPGAELAAIADLQSFDVEVGGWTDKRTTLVPSAYGFIDVPVDLFGGATARAGVYYGPSFTGYAATAFDQAGVEQAVKGKAFSRHQTTYDAALDSATGFMELTTVEERGFYSQTYTKDIDHTIILPISLTIEPADDFRMAIGFNPRLVLSSQSYDVIENYRETTTFSDGDGVAAATDLDDYLEVYDEVSQPYTWSQDTMDLDLNLNAAVQIYLIPEKFRLNLGSFADVKVLDRTTTSTVYTGNETTTTTTTIAGVATVTGTTATTRAGNEFSQTVTDAASGDTITFEAGFTYFHSPSVQFDFKVLNDNAFNFSATTDNGGFFNLANYSVQLTILLPPGK